MQLDVRVPMGLMFVILGVVLVLTGLLADPANNARSLNINLNLWWGLLMTALGALMLFLARRPRPK